MKKYIISFISELESFKSDIKQLHWHANSLPQHQLCDDIADIISDYQDKIAEVEQSISGKFPVNVLKGEKHNVTTLKKFVEDVINATNSFYSKLKNEGDEYIGMRSDTEAVLSDLQRQLYLVDFTVKESLKERLRNKINENRITVSNGKKTYSLTENELREVVSEAVNNVKCKINEHGLGKESAKRELALYVDSLKQFRDRTHKVCSLMMETGYKRASYFLAAILKEMDSTINYVENEEVKNINEIKIKDNKKGTFTAAASKHGESVQDFASKVLKNKDDYSPAMVKKANFAKNAKKWKK